MFGNYENKNGRWTRKNDGEDTLAIVFIFLLVWLIFWILKVGR